MHSFCVKNIKKAQSSTSEAGAGGWRQNKEAGCFSLSLFVTYHRETGNEKELVLCFHCNTFIPQGMALEKSQCAPSGLITFQGYHIVSYPQAPTVSAQLLASDKVKTEKRRPLNL